MNKRIISWLLTTVLLTTGSFAQAQQQAKIARIGRLIPGTAASDISAGLLRQLRELGYVEGKNIAF